MHPVHDFDALLLLATALSSKRRPAELAEIMAAADLLQSSIPSIEKMAEAFERLSRHGLVAAEGDGLVLTPDAQELVVPPSKKIENDERIYVVKENLAAYKPKGSDFPAVILTLEALAAAIREHKAAGEGAGKNLLVPKPKPEAAQARPGQRQRKPMSARGPKRK
jgi:hypothetical protein